MYLRSRSRRDIHVRDRRTAQAVLNRTAVASLDGTAHAVVDGTGNKETLSTVNFPQRNHPFSSSRCLHINLHMDAKQVPV